MEYIAHLICSICKKRIIDKKYVVLGTHYFHSNCYVERVRLLAKKQFGLQI